MLRGWVALTGTPGVGKSTVARLLRRADVPVVELARFVNDFALAGPLDARRGSRTVDPVRVGRALRSVVSPATLALLEGHWAHDVPGVRAAVVLRLRPRNLERRLRARGWPKAKVAENVEAEAIGVVLQESVHRLGARATFEVDATGRGRTAVARDVRRILDDSVTSRRRFRPGRVDWADDILSWYGQRPRRSERLK